MKPVNFEYSAEPRCVPSETCMARARWIRPAIDMTQTDQKKYTKTAPCLPYSPHEYTADPLLPDRRRYPIPAVTNDAHPISPQSSGDGRLCGVNTPIRVLDVTAGPSGASERAATNILRPRKPVAKRLCQSGRTISAPNSKPNTALAAAQRGRC